MKKLGYLPESVSNHKLFHGMGGGNPFILPLSFFHIFSTHTFDQATWFDFLFF